MFQFFLCCSLRVVALYASDVLSVLYISRLTTRLVSLRKSLHSALELVLPAVGSLCEGWRILHTSCHMETTWEATEGVANLSRRGETLWAEKSSLCRSALR